jgi:hypothetical protein
MPSRFENPAIYLQSGDPEKENTPTLHAPGLLGSRFTVVQPTGRGTPAVQGRSKRYQLVKTDSTMTVGPYPGATAYWADKANYLVTTVNTNLNAIAGKFSNLVDKGNYTCIQFGGPGYVKFVDGSVGTAAVGDSVIGSAATAGKADRVAAGTAPSYVALGRVSTPITKLPAEALVLVDLDVPETT